ncbi:MAG: ribosome maturation factor [Bacteroidota bacterium]
MLQTYIGDLARPIVEARGAILVDVSVRGGRGRKVVEVFVDTDEGTTTGLCAEISRDLSSALDQANIVQGRYDLVVSSPGIDRPLRFARQYPRNVGRTLVVKFRKDDRVEKVEGELIEVRPDGFVLQMKSNGPRNFLFDEIVEARVKPAW